MRDRGIGSHHAMESGAMGSWGCPICDAAMPLSERYPRQVCALCMARARSPDGRLLTFFNLGFDGGYGASFADTDEPYDSHECLIDDVRCHADEARFGGVVVEVKI